MYFNGEHVKFEYLNVSIGPPVHLHTCSAEPRAEGASYRGSRKFSGHFSFSQKWAKLL